METNPVSTTRAGLHAGFTLGLLMIILFVVHSFVPALGSRALSLTSMLVLAAGIVWACVQLRRQHLGVLPFGRALKLNLLVLGVATLVNSLFMYLYMLLIDNGFIELIREERLEKLRENMPEEQALRMLEATDSLLSPGVVILFVTLSTLLLGFVFAFVVAVILRKEESTLANY